MKITYKGDYALKALFVLALHYDDEGSQVVVPIQQIAKAGDMPKKFLEQIFLALTKGGFVKSRRGVNGGFQLARAPKDITIGEVIRYIEGPVEPIACVERNYRGCKDVTNCIFRGVWKEVGGAISAVIDTLTFEEMIRRFKKQQTGAGITYDYTI